MEGFRYLIIGGAPKAGTTSIFKYLADHPQVCASSIKESRFFVDADFPLPSPVVRFDGSNLDAYARFFSHFRAEQHRVMVDATPEYRYSKAILRIAGLLPEARIAFILRDPVERMLSWFKYARQRGFISQDMTFEAYVQEQIDKPITADTPIHLRALDQCRYEKYLPGFREAFGERCLTRRFEELKNDPRSVMYQLCDFSGLDASFYDTYSFTAQNVSYAVRNVWVEKNYNAIRRKVEVAFHDYPAIKDVLRKPNRLLKKLLKHNRRNAEDDGGAALVG